MRETIAALFAPLDGRADAVEAIAKPYPSRVIATLMGAPLEDAERLWDWSNLIQRQFGMTVAEERPQIEQAVTRVLRVHRAAARGTPRARPATT